ncbi:MAG TPA: STAS domain-containing protein [Pyrinomonadaceae bacterium]|jgi:anti-anti-sigma factor
MTTHKFELSEREAEGSVVIEVSGELSVSSDQERLLETVRKNIEAGRRLLVINMARCRRVDSAGIGELVACLVTATRHDATLRLSNIPPQIYGIMKITNVLKSFDVFETEQAALEKAI